MHQCANYTNKIYTHACVCVPWKMQTVQKWLDVLVAASMMYSMLNKFDFVCVRFHVIIFKLISDMFRSSYVVDFPNLLLYIFRLPDSPPDSSSEPYSPPNGNHGDMGK